MGTRAATVFGVTAIIGGAPIVLAGAAFAAAGVPTCMIFVRNENGSHNPDERMETSDLMDACQLLTHWLVDLAK